MILNRFIKEREYVIEHNESLQFESDALNSFMTEAVII